MGHCARCERWWQRHLTMIVGGYFSGVFRAARGLVETLSALLEHNNGWVSNLNFRRVAKEKESHITSQPLVSASGSGGSAHDSAPCFQHVPDVAHKCP